MFGARGLPLPSSSGSQRLMSGASAAPFSAGCPGALCRSRKSLRAQPAGASFCGKPLARGGGGGGGASRWEEAEAEGHAGRSASPRSQKLSAKLRAAAWLRGVLGRRSGSSGTWRDAGAELAHARAGLLVGTRSSCGSARAAAAKMPALRPAALRALLWLWLCAASPAHGEYRAPERPSLCLCAPRAASS